MTVPTSGGMHAATSSTLEVSGTAADAVGVTQVSWSTDRGASGLTMGTTDWTIPAVPLGAGTTAITVTARDAANNTASATLIVTYTPPPGLATLIGPSGVLAETTPSFTWNAVSDATHYELWVNDAGQTSRINTTYTAAAAGCGGGTGTCTVSPGVVLAPGAWIWWVRTSNGGGVGPSSAPLAFTVPAPPDTVAPTIAITAPTALGIYRASSATLVMSGTAGDDVGVTQVSWTTDRGGSGVATGTTAWTIAAVPLGAGTTVVTVTARDAANHTANAALTVTYTPPPAQPTLVAPSGTLTDKTPSFTWNAVSGATHYQLSVNDASQTPRIDTTYTAAASGCGAGTGTCTVSPGVALAMGAGSWRVRAASGTTPGPWSEPLTFMVLSSWRVVFVPSTDHDTVVTRYVLQFLTAGADPDTAIPVGALDIGKPPIVNGECNVDIEDAVLTLPPGTYVAIVWAMGPQGSSRSAPSPPFTR
jgi:hypothetical protein